MAVIKKIVKSAVPVPSVKAAVAPVATKSLGEVTGREIVSMANISLLPSTRGGRGTSPLVAKIAVLRVGQGFRITQREYDGPTERTNAAGVVVHGCGIASVYNYGRRHGRKFRVRKDTNGQLWMFRDKDPVEEVVEEVVEEEVEE